MNNIWKFSLIFAFTVIFDQMLKGTVQGFMESDGSYKIFEGVYLKAIIGTQIENYLLLVCQLICLAVLIYLIRNIILYRNKSLLKGMLRTFSMIGVFTLLLDLLFTGYFVDYISIFGFGLSLGKVLLILSVPSLVIMNMRDNNEANSI